MNDADVRRWSVCNDLRAGVQPGDVGIARVCTDKPVGDASARHCRPRHGGGTAIDRPIRVAEGRPSAEDAISVQGVGGRDIGQAEVHTAAAVAADGIHLKHG